MEVTVVDLITETLVVEDSCLVVVVPPMTVVVDNPSAPSDVTATVEVLEVTSVSLDLSVAALIRTSSLKIEISK